MRILVIEDNIRLADTIADALRCENYIVDIANDGMQGYEDAASGIYDMLILDLMLPKMNGYEVLSTLRREGNDIPVLILSARTELDDKVQGFAVGADDYVTKPFEIQELLMRIQAITRRRVHQDIQLLHAGNLAFDNNTCEISNTDTGKTMKINGAVPAGEVYVDGSGVGDVGAVVMRDRKRLAEDGMVVVVLPIATQDGALLSPPEIITRGFIYVKESGDLMKELQNVAMNAADSVTGSRKRGRDDGELRGAVKSAVSSYLFKNTKRSPMVIPVVTRL